MSKFSVDIRLCDSEQRDIIVVAYSTSKSVNHLIASRADELPGQYGNATFP